MQVVASKTHKKINDILRLNFSQVNSNIEDSMILISEILKQDADMSQKDILDYIDELEYFLMANDDLDFEDSRFLFALNSIHDLFIF
jgi:hypothetical protein